MALSKTIHMLKGKDFIQSQLEQTPQSSGVYQMIDESKNILYIGKAKNLKKRINSYTKNDLSTRITRMVFCVREIKYILTNSEAEALLLEATLIKKFKPKFNVLLKDDKSFAYIKITNKATWPQISKFRGKLLEQSSSFGPFVSSKQIDVTIKEIQKIFKIRTCSDTFFNSRKRPCLLYQIQKCSGPCVNKISAQEYQDLVTQSIYFLSGKSKKLIQLVKDQMQEYSKNFEYEKAASARDRLKAVEAIQARNSINLRGISDADVIAIGTKEDIACVQVFIYRGGQNFGTNSYFPINAENTPIETVLTSFLGQFYQNKQPPSKILLNIDIKEEASVIEDAMLQLHQISTKIIFPKTQEQKILMQMVQDNVHIALEHKINKSRDIAGKMLGIQEIFNLKTTPKRIEVYDNSHLMGQYAVGAMIVASENGFEKNQYRKFNIRTNTNQFGGDDYQMLREVLTRRLAKLDETNRPDLIIIDGGKGHLSIAQEVIKCMSLDLAYVCMSKGPDRNKGNETFHMIGKEPFTLPNDNKIMQYLQTLRNEVHNFAISAHRHKRNSSIEMTKSKSLKG